MKNLVLFFCVFFLTNLQARLIDDSLEVVKEGLVITVMNFEEGDKIKLFELESGDHILSKSRGELDLSQLPIGQYLLENNKGESVIIEKTEFDITFDKELGTDYMVTNDSQLVVSTDLNLEEELENYYGASNLNTLEVIREGDLVTVIDFEEGDVIKLFEVKDTVHVLSKTIGVVDLSQLPSGKYLLENDKGQFTIIEKFDNVIEYAGLED